MSNVNTVVVSGNAVADPELRYAGADGDFAIGNVRIANNRDKKQADGSYASEASFFDVTVLGNFAKLVERKLRKGDAITVQGRLEQQRWEDKETGAARSKVVIIAADIDGACFYKKDEDVAARADGGSSTAAPAATGQSTTAADDDIPF